METPNEYLMFDTTNLIEYYPSTDYIKQKTFLFGEELNIPNDYKKLLHTFDFDVNSDFRWYVERNVKDGFDPNSKNGKFITRLEKYFSTLGSGKVLTKHPFWPTLKQKIGERYSIASRKSSVYIKFIYGYDQIIDAIKVNESSCYNKEYAYSIDNIIANNGFAMVSCNENGEVDYKNRAWILPIYNEYGEIESFALFNPYGEHFENADMASKIFASIFGQTEMQKIEDSISGAYTNCCEYWSLDLESSEGVHINELFSETIIQTEPMDQFHNMESNPFQYVSQECQFCHKDEIIYVNRDDEDELIYCYECHSYNHEKNCRNLLCNDCKSNKNIVFDGRSKCFRSRK